MKNLKKLLWLMYFSIVVIIMAHTFMLHSEHEALMSDNEKIMKEIHEITPVPQP